MRENAQSVKIGDRFGNLIVKSEGEGIPRPGNGKRKTWLCECDCGVVKQIHDSNLKRGASRSCGCKTLEGAKSKNTSHGETKGKSPSPEYTAWASMLARCRSERNSRYSEYGWRGINVCSRWDAFENFLEDMGRKPTSKHTIDRINVNGDYEPGNCRWATQKEQQNNKRINRLIQCKGVTLNITQWGGAARNL